MKTRIILLLLLHGAYTNAQSFSQSQLIFKSEVFQPIETILVDFNNDGLLDVMAISEEKVVWYENLGNDTFGEIQLFQDDFSFPLELKAADLYGDSAEEIVLRCKSKLYIINNSSAPGSAIEITGIYMSDSSDLMLIDIDSDDDLDIVLANLSSTKELIICKNSNGLIEFYEEMDEDQYANYLEFMDVDNDGLKDLVYTSTYDVYWKKNLDELGFDNAVILFEDISSGKHIKAADLNNDGLLDFVLTSEVSNEILWFEGMDEGMYSDEIVLSPYLGNSIVDIKLAYIDDNEFLDILLAADGVTSNENKLVSILNPGGPSFDEPLVVAEDLFDMSSIDVGHLNEDGQLDLIMGSKGNDQIEWFSLLDNSDLQFEKALCRSLGSPRSVDAKDIDNDGDLDLITSSYNDGNIYWFENLFEGDFSLPIVIDTHRIGVSKAAGSDVDGDGDVDVVASFRLDNSMSWYENNGSGEFLVEHVISESLPGVITFELADLNNDGFDEIVSSAAEDDQLFRHHNNGDGTFSEQVLEQSYTGGAREIKSGLFNNDDVIDIIHTDWNDQGVNYLENSGGGGLLSGEIINDNFENELQGCSSIAVADLDGDGKDDILAGSSTVEKLVWFRGNGNGSFDSQEIVSSTQSDIEGIMTGDIDNDGDIDVISRKGNFIVTYSNDGAANFDYIESLSNVQDVTDGIMADFDNDGDLDIAATSNGRSKLVWFENDLIDASVFQQDVNSLTEVYPNPFLDDFVVSINDSMAISSLTLTDFQGRVISTYSIPHGKSSFNLNGSHLEKGIYFLSIGTSEFTKVKRIFKY